MNTERKFIVGLTGGIGSGKSAAAEVFKSLGITVVNADDLSREVVEPGQAALKEISKRFGDEILSEDGSLHRAQLREIVFTQVEHKDWLESLLHPLIAELIVSRLHSAQSDYAILESPLLLETEQYKLVDRILVIDASEESQLTRALKRDGSDEAVIRSIIASQIDRSLRIERADDVVINEESLSELEAAIHSLHQQYREMALKI